MAASPASSIPSLAVGPLLARRFALNGDLDTYRELIERGLAREAVRKSRIHHRFARDASSQLVQDGDLETVRRCRPSWFRARTRSSDLSLLRGAAWRAARGGVSIGAGLLASFEPVLAGGAGPRLYAFMRQLAMEPALAPMGAIETAMSQLRLVTGAAAFVDADWLRGALPRARSAALRASASPRWSRASGCGRMRSGDLASSS